MDFDQIMFIEHKINKLNDLGVFRDEFAKTYISEIENMKLQNTMINIIRVDKYIRRSFNLRSIYNSRCERMMNTISLTSPL